LRCRNDTYLSIAGDDTEEHIIPAGMQDSGSWVGLYHSIVSRSVAHCCYSKSNFYLAYCMLTLSSALYPSQPTDHADPWPLPKPRETGSLWKYLWFRDSVIECPTPPESVRLLEAEHPEECETRIKNLNIIVGIVWVIVWTAFVMIVAIIILKCRRHRRVLRETRRNARDCEAGRCESVGRSHAANWQSGRRIDQDGTWHSQTGPFTDDYRLTREGAMDGPREVRSLESQRTGLLDRIQRQTPISFDGTSDINGHQDVGKLPFNNANRRVGLSLFPKVCQAYSSVSIIYRIPSGANDSSMLLSSLRNSCALPPTSKLFEWLNYDI
jgi:hypothetical protein